MTSLLLLPLLLASPLARVTLVDIQMLESGDTRLAIEGNLFNPDPQPASQVRVLIQVLGSGDKPVSSFWLPDRYELDAKQTVRFKASRFLSQPHLSRIRVAAEPHTPTLDDPLVISWILHGQRAMLAEWGVQVDVDLDDPLARTDKAIDLLKGTPHTPLLNEALALKQLHSSP